MLVSRNANVVLPREKRKDHKKKTVEDALSVVDKWTCSIKLEDGEGVAIPVETSLFLRTLHPAFQEYFKAPRPCAVHGTEEAWKAYHETGLRGLLISEEWAQYCHGSVTRQLTLSSPWQWSIKIPLWLRSCTCKT